MNKEEEAQLPDSLWTRCFWEQYEKAQREKWDCVPFSRVDDRVKEIAQEPMAVLRNFLGLYDETQFETQFIVQERDVNESNSIWRDDLEQPEKSKNDKEWSWHWMKEHMNSFRSGPKKFGHRIIERKERISVKESTIDDCCRI